MNNKAIPFEAINWDAIPKIEHRGESGMSWWQSLELFDLRIRIVEFSRGYLADHWCQKGHIVHCLKGEFTSEEQQTGEKTIITENMTYIVSDDQSSHRSFTEKGAKLLIIDGAFLKAV